MAVRREVLGDAHVDRAVAATTDFTADFQRLITEYAWGTIWTRPGLDRRSRSLITLTALVARGHHEELAMHLRAARRNGLTNDEIKELLMQTAIYCGVPDANTAFRIAADVLADFDDDGGGAMSRTVICDTAREAVAGIEDGSTVLVGGFGMAGMPTELIDALIDQGATDLTIVSNNAGNGDTGLAALLAAGRVRKVICSFPRQTDSYVFDGLYRAGKVELEVVPQGNLAERMQGGRGGHRRVLLPDRRRHPAGRRQGDADDRRPRLRARVPDPRRRRADRRPHRRPDGQPGVPQDRPQLRPGDGDRGGTDDRRGVPRRRGRRASIRKPWSRRASSSTASSICQPIRPPDRGGVMTLHVPAGRQSSTSTAARWTAPKSAAIIARDIPPGSYVNLGIGQPTTGRRLPDARGTVSCCTPRTACSAWAAKPTATTSTPT